MTAAYRLKGLGWFASCTAIVLGFYLVSLQVASERNKLDGMNRKIASAERDIRALETEFDTRANLQQLEKWNGDILALSAPVAGQFVGDEAQLASVRFDAAPQATPGQGEVKTAALVVPSLPTPAAPVQTAAVASNVAAAVPAASTPAVAKPSAAARLVQAAQAIVRRAPAPKAEPAVQKVAMLERGLISDSTLGDILSGARAEARRR